MGSNTLFNRVLVTYNKYIQHIQHDNDKFMTETKHNIQTTKTYNSSSNEANSTIWSGYANGNRHVIHPLHHSIRNVQ